MGEITFNASEITNLSNSYNSFDGSLDNEYSNFTTQKTNILNNWSGNFANSASEDLTKIDSEFKTILANSSEIKRILAEKSRQFGDLKY